MRCPSCADSVESGEMTCPACGASTVDGKDQAMGDEEGRGDAEGVARGHEAGRDSAEEVAAEDEGAGDDAQEVAAASRVGREPEVVHFRVAGFFERALAGLVDALIVLPLFAVLAWVGSLVTGVKIPGARELSFDLMVGLLIERNGPVVFWGVLLVIVLLLYCFIFLAARGQTPGKRLVGVRVVTWYGEPPTLARSLVRTLGYLASAALLLLGFIWIGFDREKRGLHDWIAGTYVVRS